MRSNRHRAWRMAIATAVIIGIAVTVPSAIAAGQKEHDPGATPSVHGGTTANIDITIKNTSQAGNISAQAFRVYIPSTMAVSQIQSVVKVPTTAAGTIIPATGAGGTLSQPTPYIEVIDANILRNRTYTIRISAIIPCDQKGTDYAFTTDVRQSNDFNGQNNQLPALSPDSSPATTNVATGCALVFTAQPQNALPGETITDTAFDPEGGDVKVAVKAADGAGATVTGFTGNVSVVSAPATTLGGTTTRALANGEASFGDLSIAAANTYTLVASTTGATNGTSDEFTVDYGVTTTCTADDNEPCTTGVIPGPTMGTTGSVTINDEDGLTADLEASFRDDADIDCAGTGYVEFGDNLFVNVTNIAGGSTAGLTKTVTLTKPIPEGKPSVTGTDEWRYQLCFQSYEQFEAIPNFSTAQENFDNLLQALSNGDFTDPAELVPADERVLGDKSDPEYRGLLPKCSLVADEVPCISSVTFGPATDDAPDGTVIFVAELAVADPQMK
jgi:hypothetical protein